MNTATRIRTLIASAQVYREDEIWKESTFEALFSPRTTFFVNSAEYQAEEEEEAVGVYDNTNLGIHNWKNTGVQNKLRRF